MHFYDEINYVWIVMLEKYVPDQLVSEYKGHMFAFFWVSINNTNSNNNNVIFGE